MMIMCLCTIPDAVDIRNALFMMDSYKSPGPDGFSPLFFKHYWHIVGIDVIKAVQCAFSSGYNIRELNHTFLAIIPKIPGASKVEQYRPIALCNVVFKLITKIVANRLRHVLGKIVSPTQAAFIPGRNITDNTILHHELMFHINNRKGKQGYMAIKIDMAKAYDRVDWSLLRSILALHGFSPPFIDLISNCISTPSFSILVNGSPHGLFNASRGIRQGDPLSPTLFIVFFDLLSRIITKAEEEGKVHGVKVSQSSPPISHLMYADDLTIYCRASANEAREISKCLRLFSEWSGQAVNLSKSSVHFSKNTGQSMRATVLHILGMGECSHNVKYLGMPFCRYKLKSTAFKDIIENVETKLSGWKTRVLSYAGRSTLITSTL